MVVVVDVTITAIAARPPVTRNGTAVTDVVMTTPLATSIVMPRLAVKIATAAVAGMIDVVVVVITIERVVARATLPVMVTRRLLGMLASHTEVETLMPVPMIGYPVDEMRSADLFRFGAPFEVMCSNLTACSLGHGQSICNFTPTTDCSRSCPDVCHFFHPTFYPRNCARSTFDWRPVWPYQRNAGPPPNIKK